MHASSASSDARLSRDTHLLQNDATNMFDVAVSMHCRFQYDDISSSDFEIMCRLLKPQGLLLVPRDYESILDTIRRKEANGKPALLCGENTGLVPIFTEESTAHPWLRMRGQRGQFNTLANDGLTVFQKF